MDDASHLQALLQNRDCACPRCGYNLRGLTGTDCPECGVPVDVSTILKRRDRLDVAWLIMVMSYTASLPWSVFFIWQRLIIRGKLHYGDDWNPTIQDYGRGLLDRPLPEAILMLASSVWWLSVPVVLSALIAFRKRIERWPCPLRWIAACLCVVILLLAYRRWQWWWYAFGFNGNRYPDWPWWYIQ
jgi:hypothetical protein